jgi:hypothetical protein
VRIRIMNSEDKDNEQCYSENNTYLKCSATVRIRIMNSEDKDNEQ